MTLNGLDTHLRQIPSQLTRYILRDSCHFAKNKHNMHGLLFKMQWIFVATLNFAVTFY